eukprot:TRINITY_DN25854_c0_g1_i4.p1 TRINITY_DN25854_c0_g1~~TRINITY_DN25854_c0_g1_i4.p1  ORF type:complete len:304 (-),score=52.57 TRINITY_DN25854_c0_g1_i4:251-1162(-)
MCIRDRSCIRAGTHYADCNGEPDYTSLMARKYWKEARAKNVVLVYSAGFDSVPVDMGCFKLQQESETGLSGIQGFVKMVGRPEISHGTTKTLVEAMGAATLRVPDGPDDQPIPSDAPRLNLFTSKEHVSEVPGVGRVKLRMKPDANNVLWSYKLQHDGSLEGFEYAQYVCLEGDQVEDNFGGCFYCCLGLCMCMGCIKCGCGRSCLECLHGPEGSGPPDQQAGETSVEFTFEARGKDGSSRVLVGKTDEMYAFTAQSLAEAGLCLRYDQDLIPMKGGHATPAAALGAPYLTRLVKHGFMKFSD